MTAGRADGGLEAAGVDLELAGRRVLDGVDLRVEPGEPVAVTGPSGSGKTALCLVLAGALPPTRGRVRLHGQPLGRSTPVGLVLQGHGLVAGLSAGENVALPLQERGLDPAAVAEQAGDALAAVGLAGRLQRLVEDLSGGERQRVGVARAIAGDPDLVVADEPTSELDPDNRARVLDLLLGGPGARRVVVVASDDPEVIGRVGRAIRLDRGRVVG